MIDTVIVQVEPVVSAIAHIIQLAVAPVFLLSAIGAILSVMTNRLARVVDRALPHIEGSAAVSIGAELNTLAARAKLISRSITLCTTTALLICAVIVVLFLGAFIKVDTSTVVALLFIAAMGTFCAAQKLPAALARRKAARSISQWQRRHATGGEMTALHAVKFPMTPRAVRPLDGSPLQAR